MMSRYHGAPATGGGAGRTLARDRPSGHEFAMLEELSYVRREAQAEANLAYEDWRRHQCRNTYAVYRAAQDRADAAQDDPASAAERLAA
jgi:hypothetical protein